MHITFTRVGNSGDTEMESEQITLHRVLAQADDASSPRTEK